MPLVKAIPKGLQNGNIITEFTDTTNLSSVTYTYPVQQTSLVIENSGEKDIFVTVGSYTDQLIQADKKWKVDTPFTFFSIKSNVNSQEFIATASFDSEEDLASLAARLADTAIYPKSKGASLDGVIDDTVAIQTSIDSGKKLLGYGKSKVTAINDLYGFDSSDDLKVVKNGVLYNSYADKYNRLVFGIEYLSSFHKKIIAGSNINMVFSGDSTTVGDGITNTGYKIDELTGILAKQDGFRGITTANRGQSGKSSLDWVNTYLSGDLAANPDLLILRWGINDPNAGGTAQSFLTNLRNGLATIRQSRPLNNLSIVLMMPNSTSDTAHNRDELWYESIVRGVKRAARDYQCCFIDTYAYLQDSRNAGDFMDDPYGIGTHIHPKEIMNLWIGDLLYNTILPRSFKLLHAKGVITPVTPFKNGWDNVGLDFLTAGYWIDTNWQVKMNGVIKAGTTTKGTVIFTFPYGPPLKTFVICSASDGHAVLRIDPNGDVVVEAYTGTWLSLEGVSFRRDATFTPLP